MRRNRHNSKSMIQFQLATKNISLVVCIITLIASTSFAQAGKPWKGKSCAVVLTYDDAIDQHLDYAVPLLDSLELKATFYLTAFSASIQNRMKEWKALSDNGHELGNHTLYHPCNGGPGRLWIAPEYDLSKYTIRRMLDEVRMTNVFLQALDGKTKRTFAFTCGDMKIGDSSFIEPLKKDFVAARAVRNQMHNIQDIDLYNVDCYMVNGETGDQLVAWAKQAEATNSLLVILFHGVNGGNALNVSLAAHSQLLHYLKQHEKDIWIAPLLEVAEYIKQVQQH